MSLKHLFVTVIFVLFTSIANAAPIDINQASAKNIAANLKGIGKRQAEAIVSERKKKPFHSLDDIAKRVKGVSKKILNNNKKNITFGKAKDRNTQTAKAKSEKDRSTKSTKQKSQSSAKADNKKKRDSKKNAAGKSVKINSASAEEIADGLAGVGPVISERIVAERKKKKFASLDDLQQRVKGIGDKIIANNKKNITF